MATRSDRPRMRPFGGLAPWHDVLAVAAELGAGVRHTETLPLTRCAGRVLAASAAAVVDVPACDRAAMDGYAVRSDDAHADRALAVSGRAAAGDAAVASPPPSGSCLEIATGATVPAGVDAVVPVEATRREGNTVWLLEEIVPGQHIARRAEDLRRGSVVGTVGDVLHPALLAACAAGGIGEVTVWARPRAVIAPTGDEVVPLGSSLAPGQVFDSNAAGLMALAAEAGGDPVHAGIVLDDVAALVSLLTTTDYDLLVTVGGTSVGRRDLVAEAMGQVGEVLVHGVAVKPGKPLLLGRVGDRPVVGLPGFPTTCMMLGYALLDPLVRRLGHRSPSRPRVMARLRDEVQSPAGKAQLLPVALNDGTAASTFTASSSVSSMASADGWIEIAENVTSLPAGAEVRVTLF